MKTYMKVTNMPTNGILSIKEGSLLRLFFDFVAVPPTEESSNEDQYSCENIDVEGSDYGSIISAIVKGKYSDNDKDAIFANYEEAKDTTSDLDAEKRTEYLQEYSDFQAWRKKAKDIANTIIY